MSCVLLRELLLSRPANIRDIGLGVVDYGDPEDTLDGLLQEHALLAVLVEKCLILPELFSIEQEELAHGRGSDLGEDSRDSSCENGTPSCSRMSNSRGCWLSS